MNLIPAARITKQVRRASQSGQAIVLIALLILVLFGMLGLAIDSGRAYVDRRAQQAAVDAAALAAGDWYENYNDLYGSTLPNAKQVYQTNLHLYAGPTSDSDVTTHVGVAGNLQQDTDTVVYPGGYTLIIVATNTQFNGYQFSFSSTHSLPLAFMQIFGGSPTVTIVATATSIVGNQRQTPALLTLSTGACATTLKGAGQLTVLGDVYTNGTACLDSNMNEAGNCYGQAGSNCSVAAFYCYNSTPGFIPYPPPCNPGDTQGGPVVPAPTLPDPGYLASSQQYYTASGVQLNRGGYTEMTPGIYSGFSISGGGCFFLDAGVYTWSGGYTSHGGLTSNELKAPNEESYSAPGTTASAVTPFWGGCAGTFTVSAVSAPSPNGIKHQGGSGNWGVEVTSVRYDQFIDPTSAPNPCFSSPGCRRESTPSSCSVVSTADVNNQGINVNITQNSPGAQYYNVYIDPNGCDGNANNFSFVGSYLAPGWSDGGAPPAVAVGAPWTGTLKNGRGGWICPVAGVTICAITYNSLTPTNLCFAQARTQLCQTPDDELAPQCFANCPPAASVPQSNPNMDLEYPPYTGGDVANENYCVVSPNPGNQSTPCATAKVTPGAVQFYFGTSDCLDQNGNGSTHVFSGEQYNWIIIYQVNGNVCSQKLNGNAETQYIGTIYSPTASWDILGSDTSPLAGQVICYTAEVTGSANVGIDFNPNYSPAPPAARLIN
jgi:Flp pilus assembly protein TadG